MTGVVRAAGRHWLWLLFLPGLGIGLAWGYLQHAPPTYLATTRVLVEREPLEKGGVLRYEPAFIATQAEILRSRAVLERVAAKFLPSNLQSAEEPTEALADALRVAAVEGTDVLQVSFRGPDGREAVRVLETLLATYRDFLHSTEQDTQSQSLAFLTHSERDLRHQLEEKQQQYRQLREKSAVVGVGQDATHVRTHYVTRLGEALAQAKQLRLELETESAALENAVAKADSERLQNVVRASFEESAAPLLPADAGGAFMFPRKERLDQVTEILAAERELTEARVQVQQLDRSLGEKHPDLTAARGRVAGLERRLAEMRESIPVAWKNQLESLRQSEQKLQAQYDSELDRIKQLDIEQLEERLFLDNIERLRAAHDSVLTEMHRRQLASESAAKGAGKVHVSAIAPPRSSGKPVWPIPVVVLALGGAVGAIAAALVIYALESSPGPPRLTPAATA